MYYHCNMNFPAKTPSLLMQLAPGLCWHLPRKDKVLYLSFDDGPHPEITREVMGLLAEYDAKATFFCVGQNVLRYPEVVQEALAAGHAVGNHTHNHLNGWKVSKQDYLTNIQTAEDALMAATGQRPRLFRPPYGRLGLMAWRNIASRYKIVMWDIAAGDYVQEWTAAKVTDNVLANAKPGSLVVMHDSEKCRLRMLPTLKAVLERFSSEGYEFRAVEG
jgi:peptidoglycan/xylan/chitin deacetylase (PgdA/CDA1 family)